MLKAVPMELKYCKSYINENHRHHIAAVRDKFRVGCENGGVIVGCVQVGRPVARRLDDGQTLEVLRLCSDGTKDVCSFLYSRAARIAKELGYAKIITYILETEDGTSLKASGWHLEADNVGGGSWDVPSRHRETEQYQLNLFDNKAKYPMVKKQRWCKYL